MKMRRMGNGFGISQLRGLWMTGEESRLDPESTGHY